jgi:hypothetical protein
MATPMHEILARQIGLFCTPQLKDAEHPVIAPIGGVVRYRPAAVTTLCDHGAGVCARTPAKPALRPGDGAASNKWGMAHERPAEMGSMIAFQAHTRNGMCGRFRH